MLKNRVSSPHSHGESSASGWRRRPRAQGEGGETFLEIREEFDEERHSMPAEAGGTALRTVPEGGPWQGPGSPASRPPEAEDDDDAFLVRACESVFVLPFPIPQTTDNKKWYRQRGLRPEYAVA